MLYSSAVSACSFGTYSYPKVPTRHSTLGTKRLAKSGTVVTCPVSRARAWQTLLKIKYISSSTIDDEGVGVSILKLCPFLSPLKSKAKITQPSIVTYVHHCSLSAFPCCFSSFGWTSFLKCLSTNVEHGGCNISDRRPGTTSVRGHHDQPTKFHTKVFILRGVQVIPQDMSHICPNGVPNQCVWCRWMWSLKVEASM